MAHQKFHGYEISVYYRYYYKYELSAICRPTQRRSEKMVVPGSIDKNIAEGLLEPELALGAGHVHRAVLESFLWGSDPRAPSKRN